MNVPQLILGNALDGSSGPPAFKPTWGEHKTWSFGAHYFFETYNVSSNSTVGHAAYGEMCGVLLVVALGQPFVAHCVDRLGQV